MRPRLRYDLLLFSVQNLVTDPVAVMEFGHITVTEHIPNRQLME